MSVRIRELEKPKCSRIKMLCDNVIDERLLKYPMVADVWSTNSFNIICGTMGSGKTSFITTVVRNVFRKCYESIYVIIPSSSRQSIQNDIYGKNLPEDQLFDDLNVDVLNNIYEKLNENTKEGYNSLLLIDDFQGCLKQPDIMKALEKICIKVRHLRTTVFFLVQNYMKIPKSLRQLAQNVILFNIGKQQLEQVFEEIIQIKKEKYEEIIDVCFKEKHSWILVNLHKSKNVYCNWDLVEF